MKIGDMQLRKENIPFTMVANEVLRDPRLSWKAKGMYAYLFSKPDDWDFAHRRIMQESSDGRHAVLGALRELEEFGLLTRTKLPTGRMVYDLAHSMGQSPKTGLRLFDEPESKNPKVRKPEGAKTGPISNTDKQVRQITSKTERAQTPGEFARKFFAGDAATVGSVGKQLEDAGISREMVIREMLKFKAYWTEPTKSGKKQKWELQQTFDIKRRLGTWFRNIAERQQSSGSRRAGAGVAV